jgi:thiol-disulfide isomerase/thioredoxin
MDKSTATPEAMMDKPTSSPDAMMDKPAATPDAMMDKPAATPDAMMQPAAWFGVTLTNVNTGTTFTLNDFKGKVVLVELMAVWCPTCLQQQQQIVALQAKLGMQTDLVRLSLDIDPNEDATKLKAFTASHGFDWSYAVAPASVAREIGQLYGDQFLNPPSTPMLIVDRTGGVHPLAFGLKSADDLMKAIEPFLKAGM